MENPTLWSQINWELVIKALGVAASFGIIATPIIVYWQMRSSVIAARRARVHERIAQWNDPSFADRRSRATTYLKDSTISKESKIKKYDSDAGFRTVIVQVLNFFECGSRNR